MYAGIKLRSLILISKDQVHHLHTVQVLYCNAILKQDEVDDVFRFVTFTVNFAVFLAQFVLSMLSDKPSKFHYVEEDDVRVLHHGILTL